MSNFVDYTTAYQNATERYDAYRDEVYGIHLPYNISDHPKKSHNIKELNEEIKFYYDVIRDITDDEYFVEMSNSDGTESCERVGGIYIWFRNDHLTKIESVELTTYKDIKCSNLGPGDLERMLKYLKRYYSMYKGEVIEILFVQDNDFAWTLKDEISQRIVNGEDKVLITEVFSKYDISGRHEISNNWVRRY